MTNKIKVDFQKQVYYKGQDIVSTTSTVIDKKYCGIKDYKNVIRFLEDYSKIYIQKHIV